MATASGRNPAALSELLYDEGWRFEFFQAVRLLQRLRPGREPVGEGDDPARESVRFSSDTSFNFPPGDIASVTASKDEDGVDSMLVNFLGVATPASYGSLPSFFTELIHEQERGGEAPLRAWFDCFNHRLISLFYRAWQKCRVPIAYEAAADGGDGCFEEAMFSLLGLGTPGLRGRLPFDDRALLALAGQMGSSSASAASVGDLIAAYFRIPVEVCQMAPAFYEIEDGERSRLGRFGCELGKTLTLGSRVNVAQASFRLRLGPLSWEQYCEFLPSGAGHAAMDELLRMAVGPQYDFEFQMVLAAESVSGLRLVAAEDPRACRLGWSTWLCTEELAADPPDVFVSARAG